MIETVSEFGSTSSPVHLVILVLALAAAVTVAVVVVRSVARWARRRGNSTAQN